MARKCGTWRAGFRPREHCFREVLLLDGRAKPKCALSGTQVLETRAVRMAGFPPQAAYYSASISLSSG